MGTCSDPYEGKPIAALAPQYFICEEPSFSEKDKKRKLTGIVGKQANLPCHPSKGIPTPTASWTKNGGTLRENDVRKRKNKNECYHYILKLQFTLWRN